MDTRFSFDRCQGKFTTILGDSRGFDWAFFSVSSALQEFGNAWIIQWVATLSDPIGIFHVIESELSYSYLSLTHCTRSQIICCAFNAQSWHNKTPPARAFPDSQTLQSLPRILRNARVHTRNLEIGFSRKNKVPRVCVYIYVPNTYIYIFRQAHIRC